MPDAIQQTLLTMAPELWLTGSAVFVLLVGLFARPRICPQLFWLTCALLAAAFVLVAKQPEARAVVLNGMFISDAYTRLSKLLLLGGAVLTLLISGGWLVGRSKDEARPFEYLVLFLFSTLGMMLLISAQNLLSVYMALELSSLALYVLAAFERDHAKSSEAGLKYFVLGALSSGMLLFGISLIYGFSGTLDFAALSERFAAYSGEAQGNATLPPPALIVGLILLMVGFCFKLSAVPFHMWTPDVYEGAPTPVTAYFAVVPKIGAMLLFARLLLLPMADLVQYWQQVVIFVSVASMLVGAFAAIVQVKFKRLLAYSSIGHVGFMLMGIAADTPASVQGVLTYLAVYLFMSAGVFGCLLLLKKDQVYLESIHDLAGLSRTHPVLAASIAVFMFSMAGIPPLAGFFGKLYVIVAVISGGLAWLAVVGLLTSVVSCYYYLRIVKLMYFDEPDGLFHASFDRAQPFSVRLGLAASAFATVAFVFLPGPLIDHAKAAAEALLP